MENHEYKESVIPKNILDVFFEFLDQNNTTTKRYYDVDDVTKTKVQVKEVTETRQNDLKASLSLFEKMYPQYFDKLTQERILKAQQDTGKTELEDIKDALRKGFDFKD